MTDVANSASPSSVTTASVPDSYDPAKNYDVTLSRVVEWPPNSGFLHSPRDHHVIRGDMCAEISHAIATAKPV